MWIIHTVLNSGADFSPECNLCAKHFLFSHHQTHWRSRLYQLLGTQLKVLEKNKTLFFFFLSVRRLLQLNVANMPKAWKTRSLLMATRLWAFRRLSTVSSWPGYGRTPGLWHPVWWQERGWIRSTRRLLFTLSSPHFMETVSCRRMRASSYR